MLVALFILLIRLLSRRDGRVCRARTNQSGLGTPAAELQYSKFHSASAKLQSFARGWRPNVDAMSPNGAAGVGD
jgi:hypothetical protein